LKNINSLFFYSGFKTQIFRGPPFTCYILSDESSIPFYSTSNGYKYNGNAYFPLDYNGNENLNI